MKQKLQKIISHISQTKDEPKWMLEFRLKALDIFLAKKMPEWGADLKKIDFDQLLYYQSNKFSKKQSWRDIPSEIRRTYNDLGLPEAEKKYLAGLGAQQESETIYHHLKNEWAKKGIIFEDTDSGLQKYPQLFKKYFGRLVPASDNKFAALNSAFWSGGSFLYLPKNVKLDIPVQAYFRIDRQGLAQFERTLIIAEEGAEIQYVEGCSAPLFSQNSLHAGVVEIFVQKNAQVRYTTIQNWSKNVYNLVTKRATVAENGFVEWIDGNIGSAVTMKYPSSYLVGRGAKTEIFSLSTAGSGQNQDIGARVFHLAPETSSLIHSKSIAQDGGQSIFRAKIEIAAQAKKAKTRMVCQGLILDNRSQTTTLPTIEVQNDQVSVEHEATIFSISADQLFYLQTRGLTEKEASALIVNGFFSPIVKKLPMEYAVEINQLMRLNMTKTVI